MTSVEAYMRTPWFKIIVAITLLVVGVLIGWYLGTHQQVSSFTLVRQASDTHQLIDPVLYTEIPESLSFPRYQPLKDAVVSEIHTDISTKKATDVSIYVRDLNESRWIGVNTEEKFWPASMLKVVTLLAVLHTAETFPPTLASQVHVTGTTQTLNSEQDFYKPANPAQSGQTYSVEQLLEKDITESDNVSNSLLVQYVGDPTMQQVFTDLHVPIPSATNTQGVTTQDYSHLFRVLYNASYLDPANSERALELLSKTTFTQGIVAGVPAGVTVAHKFGESTSGSALVPNSSGSHELHDCGIVYYPNHPYFICVMTRGADFPTLAGVIKDISHTVWTQYSLLYPST